MSSLAAPKAPTVRASCAGTTSTSDTLEIVSRLASEFPSVDRQTVDRQVRDTWNCAVHLSADVTPGIVEELAREHLIALDGSLDLIRPLRAADDNRCDQISRRSKITPP